MQKEMLPYLQKIISLEQAAYVEEKVLNVVKNGRENTGNTWSRNQNHLSEKRLILSFSR